MTGVRFRRRGLDLRGSFFACGNLAAFPETKPTRKGKAERDRLGRREPKNRLAVVCVYSKASMWRISQSHNRRSFQNVEHQLAKISVHVCRAYFDN
jgi:hypothetical protein